MVISCTYCEILIHPNAYKNCLKCTQSAKWAHKACISNNALELNEFIKNRNFLCINCSSFSEEVSRHSNVSEVETLFQKYLLPINRILDLMETRMAKLNDRLRILETDHMQIKQDIDSLKTSVTGLSKMNDNHLSQLRNAKEILNECEDRPQRKRNVMLFNVAESDKLEKDVRIAADLDRIKDIMNQIIDGPKPVAVFRIGKKSKNLRPHENYIQI